MRLIWLTTDPCPTCRFCPRQWNASLQISETGTLRQAVRLMPPLQVQSAYRAYHSTETALLRVMSDVFAAADQQRVTLFGLLDLSAAFDCVDHNTLLLHASRASFRTIWSGAHLAAVVSVRPDSVRRLRWSHIAGRRVTLGSSAGLRGGPLLFLLHTAEIFSVVTQTRPCASGNS